MSTADTRRDELKAVFHTCQGCTKCPQLAATRTTVVFGAGNADADLMLVGEAPGANEDKQGLPFVGQAGKLLDQLLAEIGLSRSDVFICNTLKCRPPGNRDPHPIEIDNCQGYLLRQVELVQPKLICTLGNFATKLLRGDQAGITRVHGRDEVKVIGTRAVRLMPLLHPAAALYTRSMLDTLRADVARIPELLAAERPEVQEDGQDREPEDGEDRSPEDGEDRASEDAGEPEPEPVGAVARSIEQLGLF